MAFRGRRSCAACRWTFGRVGPANPDAERQSHLLRRDWPQRGLYATCDPDRSRHLDNRARLSDRADERKAIRDCGWIGVFATERQSALRRKSWSFPRANRVLRIRRNESEPDCFLWRVLECFFLLAHDAD